MGMGPGNIPRGAHYERLPPKAAKLVTQYGRFEWHYDVRCEAYDRFDRELNTVTTLPVYDEPSRIPKVKRKEHRHGPYSPH